MTEEESDALDRPQFVQTVDQLVGVLTGRREATRGDFDHLVYRMWHAYNDVDGGIEGLDAEEENLVLSIYNDLDGLDDPHLAGRRQEIVDHLRDEARLLKDHIASRA